ncbi:homeobox protein Mohawk [Culicoides brevitarsis]|uniref:homeobox protein Mohawk n=1 Tax=Culicoides brevitarsis TaxID=469753 RepID=UPI00307BCA35
MERSRPVRNRRQSRKTWPSDMLHRPLKRLFTPEIKRMLKDWLVRRRENPYPSRDEKKKLAQDTGLTYTQICNWFANWRRKLKNSGKQKSKKNWGNLIKNYNTSARGNVEQFSICSSDSIWGENNCDDGIDDFEETNDGGLESDTNSAATQKMYELPKVSKKRAKRPVKSSRVKDRRKTIGFMGYKSGSSLYNNSYGSSSYSKSPCYQICSTVDPNFDFKPNQDTFYPQTQKFKNHIIEKYLRGLDESSNLKPPTDPSFTDNNNNQFSYVNSEQTTILTGPQLSKWLESAANFTPSRENYIEWYRMENDNNKQKTNDTHHTEEIEAAEALTKLAINFRNRLETAAH